MAKTAAAEKATESIDSKTGEIVSAPNSSAATPAVQQTGQVAIAGMDDYDFAQDAGAGMEEAGREDFAIPFFSILQPLSPQCDPEDGIEGAKPGMIFNSVTQSLHEALIVVPCAYERRFIEWKPRSVGGGFVAQHMPSEVEPVGQGKIGRMMLTKNDRGEDVTRLKHGNNDLRDTRTYYVMAIYKNADGTYGYSPAVISMASTQIKVAKRWASLIQGVQVRGADGRLFTPAMFSHMYELRVVKNENEQGKWYGWTVSSLGKVPSREIYEAAREFNKMVAAGKVKVQLDDADLEAGAGNVAGGAPEGGHDAAF